MSNILEIRRTRRYRMSIWGFRLVGLALVLLMLGIVIHALLPIAIPVVVIAFLMTMPMHLEALSEPGVSYATVAEWQLADAANLRFW